MPFERPVTVKGLAAPVAVMPSGDDVTVYEIIALPPLDAGGIKLTVACAFPATALAPAGAPGTVVDKLSVAMFESGETPAALKVMTL